MSVTRILLLIGSITYFVLAGHELFFVDEPNLTRYYGLMILGVVFSCTETIIRHIEGLK